MVAIVTGNGLGLFNASNTILGRAGVLGGGMLGQSGGRGYVNAVTGNLVLQSVDEQLSGRGADLLQLRTYNSRGEIVNGEFTDGDGDGWRWDGERTVKFDAALDTVIRTDGYGSETRYTRSGSVYVSTDGNGAHDVITREGTQWVWTDGSSRLEERYGDSTSLTMIGRLQSQKDASGNLIDFEYSNNRLFRITDHDSRQRIQLTYATVSGGFTRLTQVDTFELGVDGTGRATGTVSATPLKQVEYSYNAGRLETVKTVLDPSASPLTYYTTTYGYADATTKNIASITQSDGTRVEFEYYLEGAHAGKIQRVTDASGTQTFTYVSATQTDIRFDVGDGTPKVWSYLYDSTTKQLTQIKSPAPSAGGAPLVTTFHYDANGNVDFITDARGNTVTYKYDAQGNRTRERDAEGNTVSRTYNSKNQVETETRYLGVDPNGGDEALPTDALTTRFVYDAVTQTRLRFVVTAEGRVSESRYASGPGGFGLLTSAIRYTADRYEASTFTESALAGWVTGRPDKSQVELTHYSYDLRGNLSTRRDFAKADSAGEGVLDAAATVSEYIYSGHGELLQTIVMRGANRDQRGQLTSVAYDGLGRETQRIDSSGTQTTLYNGVGYGGDAKSIQVTTGAGLVELRSFDNRGRLVSVTHSAESKSRATQYVYDSAGRLRMVQDAQGGQRFSFYDAANRLQYQVDSRGAVIGFEYNASGQLVKQTRYANLPSPRPSSWYDGTAVTQHSLTVGGAGSDVVIDGSLDRVTHYDYDAAGRLTTQTDAANVVTRTTYDGASQVTVQQSGNRVTRHFYDRDGRLVGRLDPLGYLTENKFDAAGRLVETVRYDTRSPHADANLNRGAPVWIGVTNQSATGGQPFAYRLHAFDADGDPLSYRLVGTVPGWLSLDTAAPGFPTLRGTPPADLTSYSVTVRAEDGRGASTDVTVRITVGNSAPRWSSVLDDAMVRVNTSFNLTLPPASDNETAAGQLVYSIVGGTAALPLGLSFDAAQRRFSGTPTRAGTYVITVRVADGTGAQALFTHQSFVVQVTNEGPSWSRPPDLPTGIHRNQPFSFVLPGAVDPDGEALSYAAINKPSWLSFSVTGGVLTLTGTPTALGPHLVEFEATDASGAKVRLSFILEVVNRSPAWPALQAAPVTEAGRAFTHVVAAAVEPDGEALTYSIQGLPAGFTFTAPSGTSPGQITGTSTTIGVFVVTLRATDPQGAFIERTLTIIRTNAPPTYNGGLHDLGDVENGHLDVNIPLPDSMFTDANGDALSYSISMTTNGRPSTSLLVITSVNGLRRLIGIIPAISSGLSRHYVFTVSVTDGRGGQASGSFSATSVGQSPAEGEPGEAPAAAPVDALDGWRPATSAADLHRYVYFDGQGRVVGAVDEQGFLSETIYDAQANTQHSVRYMNAVTVGSTDTLATLRGRAADQPGIANDAPRITTTQYDSFGRVSLFTDVDGTTATRYTYDSAGRLVREVRGGETANEQRASRLRYNAFGELTGVVSGEGEAILTGTVTPGAIDNAITSHGTRYEYDSLGRRIKAISRDFVNGAHHDAVTLFYYDSESRLTHTVNSLGEVSETEYTTFGQVASQRRYNTRLPNTPQTLLLDQLKAGTKGRADLLAALAGLSNELDPIVSYEYDPRGLLKKSTDGEGFETINTYDDFGQLDTQTRTIKQAVRDVLAVTTTTQFNYDLRGSVLSQTSDAGGLNFNRRSVYDAFGRVIRSVDAAGKITTTAYKDSGRTIDVTYPDTGVGPRTVSTKYDAFARVLTQTDASGSTTTYTYDDIARSVRITTPITSSQSMSVVTTQTRFGEVLSVTTGLGASDTTGKTTHYEYNKNGQLTRVTDALGQEVVRNEYDNASGLLIRMIDGGVLTTLEYDAVNRVLVRHVDPNVGGRSGQNLVTAYEFNALGQQIKVVEAQGSINGERTTIYQYDRNGRLGRTTVDPNGVQQVTEFFYDGLGNTVRVSQGSPSNLNQKVTVYVFDNLGRRVKEIAAPTSVLGAGSARERDLTTEYRYDEAGRVSRRIAANGGSTWYVYNAVGELTHTIDAEGGVSQSVYDQNGRVVTALSYATRVDTAAFGDVVSTVAPAVSDNDRRSHFVYDLAGRLRYSLHNAQAGHWSISENRYDPKCDNLIETRSYEQFIDQARITALQAGGITPAEVEGELHALYAGDAKPDPVDHARRTRFAYDQNNRLRFTVDALGSVSESVYDAGGRVVAIVRYATRPTLAAGTLDEAALDAAVNRNTENNQVSRFAYDTAGRLRFSVQVLASDGQGKATELIVSEQLLDALGRVIETTSYGTVVRGAFVAADFTVTNLLSKITRDAAHDRRTAFVYDGAGRQVYRAQVQHLDGQGERLHVVSKMEYDVLGHVVQSTTYATALRLADYNRATLDAAVAADAVAQHALNRTTRYVYDKLCRQRFVVAADGSFRETVYDTLGQVSEVRQFELPIRDTTLITEDGLSGLRFLRAVGDGVTRGERYTYDKLGQRLTTTDARNFVERYSYDALGNRKTFTDKAGQVWNYTYDRLGRLRTQTTPTVLVQLSNETAAVDRRLVSAMEYDALGNLTQRTEASGTLDARTTTYEYDRLGRQVKLTQSGWYDPHTQRVERDQVSGRFQRTREAEYDALGNEIRTAVRTGPGANDFLIEHKTYDVLGRVRHDVDALGNVTTFHYNVFGDQLEVTRHSKSVGMRSERWTVDAVAAALGADNDARTVTMKYDNLGNKTQVTQPSLTYINPDNPAQTVTDAQVTRYEYNAFGEIFHESMKISAFGASQWRDTWHYFDDMGRAVRTIDALGHHTERRFDELGNLIEVTEYAHPGAAGANDGVPPRLPPAVAQDRITRFVYNALNQQTSIQRLGLSYRAWDGAQYVEVNNARDVATTILSMSYDEVGRVTARTDGMGHMTRTHYNALGQVIQITEPARVTASNGRDPFNTQLTALPRTSFTLNAFGQVLQQTRNPNGGAGATLVLKYEYDLAGNLVKSTDANYNAGVNTVPGNPDIGVKFHRYDYAGRLLEETMIIRATSEQLEGGAEFSQTLRRQYAYDALGRQTYVVDVYTPRQGVMQKAGRRADYNAFGEVTDEYKVFGNADVALDALNKPKVATYGYDKAGQVIFKRAGDGVTRYYYNVAGQVVLQEQRGSDSAAPASFRNTFTTYDVLGRATLLQLPKTTTLRPPVNGLPGSALHDIVRHIEQAYDRWGNVISRSQGGYRTVAEGLVNNTLRVTTHYTYNADNQVLIEQQPFALAWREDGSSYQSSVVHRRDYDLLGREVQQRDTEVVALAAGETLLRTRTKVYNNAGQVIEEIDGTGIKMEYAYDAHGRKVGTRNALGRVYVDEVDPNGNVIAHSVLRKPDGRAYNSHSPSGPEPVRTLINAYKYDQANRRVFSANLTNDALADQKTYVTLTRYDERGLVLQIEQGMKHFAQSLEQPRITKAYAYDDMGNKIGETGGTALHWRYDDNDYSVGRLTLRGSAFPGGEHHFFYNDFGQVVLETTDSTRMDDFPLYEGIYTYHGDGTLAQVQEKISVLNAVGGRTRDTIYRYDTDGRVAEEFTDILDRLSGERLFHQNTKTLYDSLGRVTEVSTPFSLTGSNFLTGLTYKYDALGNRLFALAHYQRGNTPEFKGTWNEYDAEGRVVTEGLIRADGTKLSGTTISYDDAGRRESTFDRILSSRIQKETFTYDDLDLLTVFEQEEIEEGSGEEEPETLFLMRQIRVYDTTGRMTSDTRLRLSGDSLEQERKITSTYDALGNLDTQRIETFRDITDLDYDRSDTGLVTFYRAIQRDKDTEEEISRTDFHYTYESTLEGTKEKSILAVRSNREEGFRSSTTINTYDQQGRLTSQDISGEDSTFPSYFYDAKGNVLSKVVEDADGEPGPGVKNYFYAQGVQVGSIGTGSMHVAEFMSAYTPISAAYPGSMPGSYVVNPQDSLASIARSVFGDASLWYLIADANQLGFGPNDELPPGEIGKTYHIPNVVNGSRNSADTFRPFSAADIIGDSTPTPSFSQYQPGCDSNQIGLMLFIVVVTAIATVATGGLGTIPSAAIGAAVGNTAQQGLDIAWSEEKTWSDNFSGWQVVSASATAGVSAGLGQYVAPVFNEAGMGGRMAFRALDTAASFLVSGAYKGFDDVSFANLGLRLAASAGLPEIPGGGLIGPLAASVFDPRSPWIFTAENRTWGSIAQQAAGAYTQIAVNFLADDVRRYWASLEHAERARSQSEDQAIREHFGVDTTRMQGSQEARAALASFGGSGGEPYPFAHPYTGRLEGLTRSGARFDLASFDQGGGVSTSANSDATVGWLEVKAFLNTLGIPFDFSDEEVQILADRHPHVLENIYANMVSEPEAGSMIDPIPLIPSLIVPPERYQFGKAYKRIDDGFSLTYPGHDEGGYDQRVSYAVTPGLGVSSMELDENGRYFRRDGIFSQWQDGSGGYYLREATTDEALGMAAAHQIAADETRHELYVGGAIGYGLEFLAFAGAGLGRLRSRSQQGAGLRAVAGEIETLELASREAVAHYASQKVVIASRPASSIGQIRTDQQRTSIDGPAAIRSRPSGPPRISNSELQLLDDDIVPVSTKNLPELDPALVGEHLGTGGFKRVSAYGANEAIGRYIGTAEQAAEMMGDFATEVAALDYLRKNGVRALNARLARLNGEVVIVMPRMAASSKDLAYVYKGQIVTRAESAKYRAQYEKTLGLLNSQSVEDFGSIKTSLETLNDFVSDTQFTFTSHGRVYLNDPLYIVRGAGFGKTNSALIDTLIELIQTTPR